MSVTHLKIKEPKLIGNLFDDAYLTEIFVPNTKIEPILDDNGNYITSTKINSDEVYVRLRTKAWGNKVWLL
ncbi:MAG: hypothetical protein KIG63_05610 [Methanobrevibacter sp.]|nr:hypothetical protein [Methanobrevibacter sp.]